MGPLPHDDHRVAVGNSYSLQAEAAPGHACAQAARATASPAAAGGARGATATTVKRPSPALISDSQGSCLQGTPAFDV